MPVRLRHLPLALTAGCTDATGLVCEASVDPDVNTVVRVGFTSRDGGDTWVEHGPTDAYGDTTAVIADADGDHEALIVAGPLEDVFWRAVVERDGRRQTCTGFVRTRNLPAEMPDFRVDVYDEAAASEERWFLASFLGPDAAIVVLDRLGRVVWYRQQPDPDLQWVEARPTRAGHLAFNEFDLNRSEDVGAIHVVGLDGALVRTVDTPMGHHHFAESDDGALLWLRADPREWTNPDTGQTLTLVGDALMRTDADGVTTELFSVWDHVAPFVHDRMHNGFYPFGEDWTHGNAVHVAADGSILVSFGYLRSVVHLEADGRVRRWYGMDGMQVAQPHVAFDLPHDPHLTDDGRLLLYMTDEETRRSGAVEYRIDEEAQALVPEWSYGFAEGETQHYATFLGQAVPMANGNRIVKWSGPGHLQEVTPDGDVVWDVQTDSGTWWGAVVPLRSFPPVPESP